MLIAIQKTTTSPKLQELMHEQLVIAEGKNPHGFFNRLANPHHRNLKATEDRYNTIVNSWTSVPQLMMNKIVPPPLAAAAASSSSAAAEPPLMTFG
ncbi:MAG: hypothetical protein ACHP65_05890 [Legionellales bacterium]